MNNGNDAPQIFSGPVWKPQGRPTLPMGDSRGRAVWAEPLYRSYLQSIESDAAPWELDGFDLSADDASDDYSGDGSRDDSIDS